MFRRIHLLALILPLLEASPAVEKRYAALPPSYTSQILGNSTSNLPNEYRDGGGGGTIDGKQWIIFSDDFGANYPGEYTSGGPPTDSNLVNFTSNSIALTNASGGGPTDFEDFGTTEKGPYQMVPFYYSNGEAESITGIWPNQNIATLCGGACGANFPVVVNRTAIVDGDDVITLYSTGINITIDEDGVPFVERPVQALFYEGEPLYGTFGTMAGIDGYLYMFAPISGTASSNGLKMARVPQTLWDQRSSYQFWDGASWTSTSAAFDDNGYANIYNFSTTTDCVPGTNYGPSNGDLFFSTYYGVYMVIVQPGDAGCDNNVYMSYSSDLAGGWSDPISIYQIPSAGSFSYSLHAYPDYDETGKTLPLSFSQLGPNNAATYIAWAEITFD